MWAIAVIAGLIALVLLALWSPLNVVLSAEVSEKPVVRFRFSWLFGLLRRELPGAGGKPADKRPEKKRKKKARHRGDIDLVVRVLKTRGLFRQTKRLVKDVFSCLNFRELVADFRVGLGNPADTGLLFAILAPAYAVYGFSPACRINIEPAFTDGAVFRGRSHGALYLRPIRLVPPLLRFTFSLPAARVVWRFLARKWKRRK